MKFTGIIRHVDEKGRISIPTELRNIIGMQE
ncbi:AbrB family transcriptional regulator, partial [Bacillus cereus]